MTESDTHCIRRLRFRGPVANPRLTRHRFETSLSEGAQASRLGKEAILCVRRLTLALHRVEKLKEALESEHLAAARPAQGPVPANANAVFFADRAELLACLARDWCAGHASAAWWWPVLFPREDFTAVARRAWLENARSVPTALERLESAGLAASFLRKLAPGDVATLWRKLVDAFDLPALGAALSGLDFAAARPPTRSWQNNAAPWASWITIAPSLEADMARLLITGVSLVRAPSKARSVSFAREIQTWGQPTETRHVSRIESSDDVPGPSNLLDNGFCPATESAPIDESLPVEDTSTKNALPQDGLEPVASRRRSKKHSPDDARRATESRVIAGEEVARPADFQASPEPGSADSPSHETHSRSTPVEHGGAIDGPAGSTDPSASPRIVSRDGSADGSTLPSAEAESTIGVVALPQAPLVDRVATEWGGVLYLAGVAIALDLYRDFTRPASPGLALPLWDFLALLGVRFIGEEFKEDPLCGLLARLSGRSEDETPGADFEVPSGEPLETWVVRICHEMRIRVAASLGLEGDHDLRPLVLNHHAKIEADAARVDAHFSLAQHPIQLRVAGLDRDPGWVPAAGRSIYFHYD